MTFLGTQVLVEGLLLGGLIGWTDLIKRVESIDEGIDSVLRAATLFSFEFLNKLGELFSESLDLGELLREV